MSFESCPVVFDINYLLRGNSIAVFATSVRCFDINLNLFPYTKNRCQNWICFLLSTAVQNVLFDYRFSRKKLDYAKISK